MQQCQMWKLLLTGFKLHCTRQVRPFSLEEFIKVGNTIYDKNLKIVRTIPKAVNLGGEDPDHIIELCNEVSKGSFSVDILLYSERM